MAAPRCLTWYRPAPSSPCSRRGGGGVGRGAAARAGRGGPRDAAASHGSRVPLPVGCRRQGGRARRRGRPALEAREPGAAAGTLGRVLPSAVLFLQRRAVLCVLFRLPHRTPTRPLSPRCTIHQLLITTQVKLADEEGVERERRVCAVCYGGGDPATTFAMLDPSGNLVDYLHCPQFRCGRLVGWVVEGLAARLRGLPPERRRGAPEHAAHSPPPAPTHHHTAPLRSGAIPKRKALPGVVYSMYDDPKKGKDAARIRAFIQVRAQSCARLASAAPRCAACLLPSLAFLAPCPLTGPLLPHHTTHCLQRCRTTAPTRSSSARPPPRRARSSRTCARSWSPSCSTTRASTSVRARCAVRAVLCRRCAPDARSPHPTQPLTSQPLQPHTPSLNPPQPCRAGHGRGPDSDG